MSSTISSTPSSTTPATSSASSAANTLISSQGIGSGLDINAIVQSLTTAAGLAQNTQLSDRKASLTAQVSAYGTFKNALETLQATLTTLENPKSLAGRTATLGDDTIATATATSDAVPAQYSLAVQNLATAASLSSQPFAAGGGATVGTGALTITVGGATATINIDGTDNTLAGIASAINGAPNNPGVTASILTTSDGARLVLSGTQTGTANAITVTQSGGDGGLSALVYDPANPTTSHLTQTQAALNANFTINGFAATSASNLVSSAITGVTINLQKTTAAGVPTTLTVGTDSTGAQTSIGTFVTALNGLMTAIQGLTSYDPTTQTAGPLLGNATLESFQNQLENILDQVQGSASSGTSLASLGIAANAQGTFDTNSTTLGNALSASLSSVTSFFGGTNGIATQLDSLITQYTQAGGLLDSINQGLQSSLSDVANQQTALNARLATYSATLTKEYNAMDTAVALLKQTQTYLTAEFNPNSSGSTSQANSALSNGTLSTGG